MRNLNSSCNSCSVKRGGKIHHFLHPIGRRYSVRQFFVIKVPPFFFLSLLCLSRSDRFKVNPAWQCLFFFCANKVCPTPFFDSSVFLILYFRCRHPFVITKNKNPFFLFYFIFLCPYLVTFFLFFKQFRMERVGKYKKRKILVLPTSKESC